MKIVKYVTLDAEVEVHVSIDDVTAAIAEEADAVPGVMRGLNNVALFLKAIPDQMVAEMNDSQKALVKSFLTEQAARF